ncbi:MAG: HU family DNA-binding protein [Ruminococcaceae bacterium]|nr:HU family DNA-binding protein [Oscillospiraceae bacterium]
MNKTDLVNVVAAEANLSKKAAEAAVNATLAAIANALKDGDKVQLIGFGTFEVKDVAAREGRNPKTGEVIKIAASKKPAFSASKVLKDQVNG